MHGSKVRFSLGQRRARLGLRHRLAVKAATPEEVAASVVALHGSDPTSVFLSAGARLAVPGHEPVERAVYEERTLVRMTGMRRTVFAVPAELVPVVHWSTMAPVARRERRALMKAFGADGWDEARVAAAEAAVLRALAEHGEADAATLGTLVPELREQVTIAAGKPYEALVSLGSRLLPLMAMDGLLVRGRRAGGTWVSGRHLWGLAPELPRLGMPEARAELARRWLAAFGPATEADLKWWTGWTLTETRAALSAVGAVEVELDEGPGLALPDDLEEVPEPEPWAALLPALDPTPMGWQARDWYLDAGHRAELFDRNGNIGPTVWWDGRVAGGWAQRPDGEIVWRLFADVGAEGRAAVEAQAAALAAWLGEVRVTPRFRTPLERELSAP
ncbi:winged helix DNA-binding domain-containing protein [Nonomuraea wenchangensis]